jgi:uncharacterized membrane protein
VSPDLAERAAAVAGRGVNWAVVTTGGMLSFAFSSPEHSHVMLLLANLLVTVFLGFEARRFRYFDVWRSRVRMLEENFFMPIIRRNPISPRSDWAERVGGGHRARCMGMRQHGGSDEVRGLDKQYEIWKS